MNIIIAEQSHIQEIRPLYRKLFQSIAELEPFFFTGTDQDHAFLESIIRSEKSDILLATNDNIIIGFAVIQLQTTPPFTVVNNHNFACLMDLLTLPEHRGKGVATALINACEAWAKERGAKYLELSVLNKNTNAYELYLKQGFNEKVTTLYKPLS